MSPSVASRLKSHRRKTGLTQREVADIVGLASDVQVFRHEKETNMPPLLIAAGYAVLFQIPIAELFPGLHEAVRLSVERSLAELEEELQQRSIKGRPAEIVARKLEWITERRIRGATDFQR